MQSVRLLRYVRRRKGSQGTCTLETHTALTRRARAWSLRAADLALGQPLWLDVW